MHSRRLETLKIDISTYRGAEEDSLSRWFVELDDAIRARYIIDEQIQVAFAQSNLAGRDKTWALGLKLHIHTCLDRYYPVFSPTLIISDPDQTNV